MQRENVSSTTRGYGRISPIRERNSRQFNERDGSSRSHRRSVSRPRRRSPHRENRRDRPERRNRSSSRSDRRDGQQGIRRQMSLEETIEAARNIGFREGVLHGQHSLLSCYNCHCMQSTIRRPNNENYVENGDQEIGYFYYPQGYFYYPEGYYGEDPAYH